MQPCCGLPQAPTDPTEWAKPSEHPHDGGRARWPSTTTLPGGPEHLTCSCTTLGSSPVSPLPPSGAMMDKQAEGPVGRSYHERGQLWPAGSGAQRRGALSESPSVASQHQRQAVLLCALREPRLAQCCVFSFARGSSAKDAPKDKKKKRSKKAVNEIITS